MIKKKNLHFFGLFSLQSTWFVKLLYKATLDLMFFKYLLM